MIVMMFVIHFFFLNGPGISNHLHRVYMTVNYSTRVITCVTGLALCCSPFLILGLVGGWRLPRRDTHTGINYCVKSSSCSVHFSVVFGKITTIDRPW